MEDPKQSFYLPNDRKYKKKKNLPPVSLVYYLVVIVKVLRKKTYEEALYCGPSMISAGLAAICR